MTKLLLFAIITLGGAIMSRHGESLRYAMNVLLSEKNRSYISKIYLYGSCARMQQKYTSDVDLFVLTSEPMTKKQIRDLKIAVSPDDYTLPSVELKIGAQLSADNQFEKKYS